MYYPDGLEEAENIIGRSRTLFLEARHKITALAEAWDRGYVLDGRAGIEFITDLQRSWNERKELNIGCRGLTA